MLVKATEICFVGGSRRRVGAIFSYDGPAAKYLVPVSQPEEEGTSVPSSEDEIIVAGKKATKTKTIHDFEGGVL